MSSLQSTSALPQPENKQRSSPTSATPGGTRWTSIVSLGVFILARLTIGVLVLLAIIYVSNLGMEMVAGAPFSAAMADSAGASLAYVAQLLQGNPGVSTAITSALNPIPVTQVLPSLMARSLILLAVALLFAALFGALSGLYAAMGRSPRRSLTVLTISIIGISAPSFFVAMLLQLLALRWTRWTGSALLPVGGYGLDSHLIMPALVLAARPLAQITRVTFVAVGNVIAQDFVRTAYGKGLHPYRVLANHILRNSAVPILTTIGVSLRFALSSLPVVELFFGWRGAGFALIKAISDQDRNMTIALLLCFGALFIGVNLILEIVYRFADPRLRDLGKRVERDRGAGSRRTLQTLWRSLTGHLSRIRLGASWGNLRRIFSPDALRARQQDLRSQGSGSAAVDWRAWRRGTIGNLPFMLGAVLVTALLGVALFGPQLVPHSPFTTLGIEFVDGKLIVPPFEPGADYPWGTDVMGRDIMSLVLAGAQLTLQLGLMVMAARMLIGTLLGALAGWFSGRWPDRAILATAETLAAFPMLILAMLLILSLGIRTGLRPFLIALSVVGWTEVMQYVRGEVMATRPKPFIESAVAIGARTRRIVWHHVLPNLLPALVSLAALEMGAVLMLMGELGYIGIFIGGGAFAELNVGGANYQYSDVPEWGALLSNVRLYARVYPWTAIYPAAAFFVAILAFNLFGEGLRRLVETVGAQFTQIWNRYTFAVILLLFVVAAWVNHNTGPMAFFRQQAIAFSAVEAENHVQRLTDPILTGRSLGSPGLDAAAAIVEENYAALGLQHGGSGSGYRQVQAREFQQLDAVPELVFDDGGAPLEYRRDFAEYAGTFRVLGDVTGPVDALVMGELSGGGSGFSWRLPRALNGVEMSEKILLLLSPEDANLVARMPYRGILIVTDDPTQLARRYTLPALDPTIVNFGGRATGQDAPIMWIGEEAANRLLAASGWTVAELRRAPASLGPDEIIQVETGITAHMQIAGTVHEGVESAHIIGHLPAVQGQGLGDQVILVTAQYDAPPLVPDGVAYPGAGDNAGGVAVMLEAIRVLQETGYRPYKTFLFVAYSGEGSELGVPAYPPDVREFLQGRPGFAKHFDIEAVVDLRGLGGADGDRLVIEAGSSLRLANLFDDAATQLGVDAVRVGAPTEIIVSGSGGASSGQIAPQVGLRWQGWEERSRTAADTPTTIEGANLEQAGRTLALGLMVLGRETQY